jgi:hypothetical protein
MANSPDMVAIVVPVVLRDRLASKRVHPRQAYYEVIEEALDLFEDVARPG